MSTNSHLSTPLPRVDLERFGVTRIEVSRTEAPRIAVIATRFNSEIVDHLVEGALDALIAAGVAAANITLVQVPGAWELPLMARTLAQSGRCDAIVALGCLIRGETSHYEVIVNESARGLADVMRDTGVPITNGVLTCEHFGHALARAGGSAGNKGVEAARAALDMTSLLRQLR